MKVIDLRSDTVTQPSQELRRVMSEAVVGDDVYGEDPTINRLERQAAEMVGKEAALFAATGTQSNLMGLLAHCQRGDEYIVGQAAHTYRYEGGGAAVLGSIQPQPIEMEPDGTLKISTIKNVVKPDDFHFARTRLICLENTHNGMALPMDYLTEVKRCAESFGLALHCDGARILNAAVKHQVAVKELAAPFDSISVCLSKGLGAPAGALLFGSELFIKEARKWRKMLGGGMRQAGILGAAGLFVLEHNVDRLADDHENRATLQRGLSLIDELTVETLQNQTNMVFVSIPKGADGHFQQHMKEQGVLVPEGTRLRLVTHLDINAADVQTVLSAFNNYFNT